MAAGHNPGSSQDVNPVSEHAAGQVTESAVREEVDRLLASPEFRASRRCQDFLRFIVEHTLAGKTDLLKERTIGMEVFGKPTSFGDFAARGPICTARVDSALSRDALVYQ
ncbi:MAG: hypothetical protein ABSE40_20385 [Candidatus Sulfotelmatobacter sp.]|jgi:hypothetical protein